MFSHANRAMWLTYENKSDPTPPASGAEMLRFLINCQAITQTEVATETGIAESTISELLAGKREMN